MNIWRDEMIEKVHEPLVTAILQDITRDRRGVSTHSNILRDVIHSFVEVRVHRAVDMFYVSGNARKSFEYDYVAQMEVLFVTVSSHFL